MAWTDLITEKQITFIEDLGQHPLIDIDMNQICKKYNIADINNINRFQAKKIIDDLIKRIDFELELEAIVWESDHFDWGCRD